MSESICIDARIVAEGGGSTGEPVPYLAGDATLQGESAMQARQNLASLFAHVAGLYTCGDSSTISAAEAMQLMESMLYVLGLRDIDGPEATALLARPDLQCVFDERRRALEARCGEAMVLWQHIVDVMPPIPNIALRDTMASLGELERLYDTFFSAHVPPCEIDYQLSKPVPDSLQGLDYIEAWLAQVALEAEYLAQFEVGSCIRVLEATCPDYRGLLVNLYDLLKPHESELSRPCSASVSSPT